MDELIKMISSQLGVTPDKAQIAVQLVMSHIKERRRPCRVSSTA